ncbi:MAG: aminopeptidase P N-terminal domain-containing protein [Betaproteobacteria bacterium]|jgi:Xaa-Pro aminopeptidase|nr:aminopeptidase P N-terminal domain-containing protein [Betaproteobacteria bacterium]
MRHIEPYRARRVRLLEAMEAGVAVVPTAPERLRNRDSDYLYRFDSYFYYLTGFPEPDALLVLVAGSKPKSVLFCREKNPERELWDGYRHGFEAARDTFGFDEAHPIAELDTKLPELLANQPTLFFAPGMDPAWDARVMGWLNQVRAKARMGVVAPADIRDIRSILDEMRLVKDEHEIATMRRAAELSAGAHVRAMRAARPGMMEYEIEAELLHEFRRHGAQFPAYWPIVASGPNACVLHYRENDRLMGEGDLLLIDAGGELDGYAADITRTFPVSGTFNGPQRAIYELVLAAQTAAAAQVKPGNRWDMPHEAAVKVIAQGLIDLGLCTGTLDSVIESEDYKRFYMHRTGHWLGLDVHDAGDYKESGEWKLLRPGMTLTVEPGCYIRPAENVPEEFWNIGVRIEDDALVTENGCELITAAAPKTVADIEALMRDARSV